MSYTCESGDAVNAYARNIIIQDSLRRRGIELPLADVSALARAQVTLHTWAEQECGDGNDYASWAIERDEKTGIPYRCVYPHQGKNYRTRIPDRERGALARVRAICQRNGLHYHHQTDPRGCALYIAREALTDSDYSSRGVAVCA